jgi:hypothetical protein
VLSDRERRRLEDELASSSSTSSEDSESTEGTISLYSFLIFFSPPFLSLVSSIKPNSLADEYTLRVTSQVYVKAIRAKIRCEQCGANAQWKNNWASPKKNKETGKQFRDEINESLL